MEKKQKKLTEDLAKLKVDKTTNQKQEKEKDDIKIQLAGLKTLIGENKFKVRCYLCHIENKARELTGDDKIDTFLTATGLGRIGTTLELRDGLYKLFFLSCMKQ